MEGSLEKTRNIQDMGRRKVKFWKKIIRKIEITVFVVLNKLFLRCTFAPKVNTTVPETSKKTEKAVVVASAATKMKAVNAFAGLLGKKPATEVQPFEF